MSYFVFQKTDFKILFLTDNLASAKQCIKAKNLKESDVVITEDVNMKVMSQIVYVDGKCVYKNKDFWTSDLRTFMEQYEVHEVLDIFGQPVSKSRFELERQNNINHLAKIDGQAGEIEYNISVGKEFICLFIQECIKTNFTKDANTSPMHILEKLGVVIPMLSAGAFRETKLFIQAKFNELTDDFLTPKRLNKYMDMLDAADVITYSTDEDYFYTVPNEAD